MLRCDPVLSRAGQFGQRALFFARVLCQNVIQRKAVFFARKTKNEKEQGKPRNDMAAEIEQRVAQKMAEGDDDEHRAEDDKRIARAQSEKNERARDEFDERNRDARHPERPDRQEGVGGKEKIYLCTLTP